MKALNHKLSPEINMELKKYLDQFQKQKSGTEWSVNEFLTGFNIYLEKEPDDIKFIDASIIWLSQNSDNDKYGKQKGTLTNIRSTIFYIFEKDGRIDRAKISIKFQPFYCTLEECQGEHELYKFTINDIEEFMLSGNNKLNGVGKKGIQKIWEIIELGKTL